MWFPKWSVGLAGVVALALANVACVNGVTTYPLSPSRATPPLRLEGDVAAGYAAYHADLDPWGRWSPDTLHGIHWCPTSAGFQPYATAGRWTPAPAGGAYGAPTGTPVWQSTSGSAWEEITLHHGWWTHPDEEPNEVWCWVPGAEATAARVVWRESDGFVAWAPEPVDDNYTGSDEDALAWTFELLGTLFEDLLDRQVLTGNAANQASQAMAASGTRGQHGGPTGAQVGRARQGLVAYLQEVQAPKAALATAGNGTTPAGTASSGTSPSSSTASASKTNGSKSSTSSDQGTSDGVGLHVFVAEQDMLPPGMLVYASLPRATGAGVDPAGAGPTVLVPGAGGGRAALAQSAMASSRASGDEAMPSWAGREGGLRLAMGHSTGAGGAGWSSSSSSRTTSSSRPSHEGSHSSHSSHSSSSSSSHGHSR